MKKFIILILNIAISTIIVYAQAPQAFNYTGIALDSKHKEIRNQNISVLAAIDDGAGGSYVETHQVTTNNNGFFSIKIGGDFPGSISGIDWTTPTSKSLTIAVDPDGGTNYTYLEPVQLLSVPFALYGADEDADPENEIQDLDLTDNMLTITLNGTSSAIELTPYLDNTDEQDLSLDQVTNTLSLTGDESNVDLSGYRQNLMNVLLRGNSAGDVNITNLADPVNDQDAATKAYVDALELQIAALEERILALEPGSGDPGGETVSDIDGNIYQIVEIGAQVWMAENLKTTTYNDGTPIDYPGIDNNAWENNTSGAYAWYDNDENTYKNVYGALYNWYTVETGKLCPTGWHVPNLIEWDELYLYLGGVVAGGKLKETGTTHWVSPNEGATNETGFSALPGGNRNDRGPFNWVGNYGYWWVDSELGLNSANYWYMFYDRGSLRTYYAWKKHGYSVRCLKD